MATKKGKIVNFELYCNMLKTGRHIKFKFGENAFLAYEHLFQLFGQQ